MIVSGLILAGFIGGAAVLTTPVSVAKEVKPVKIKMEKCKMKIKGVKTIRHEKENMGVISFR